MRPVSMRTSTSGTGTRRSTATQTARRSTAPANSASVAGAAQPRSGPWVRASMSAVSPDIRRSAPGMSSRVSTAASLSRTAARTAAAASPPMIAPIANSHGQLRWSMMTPPSSRAGSARDRARGDHHSHRESDPSRWEQLLRKREGQWERRAAGALNGAERDQRRDVPGERRPDRADDEDAEADEQELRLAVLVAEPARGAAS